MQFSCQNFSAFSACQGKFTGRKRKPCKKISSLEKGGISGDLGFRSSGLAELAIFPAKKLSYKTAHLLLNSIFPAVLL
jgi:hypothetical protein